ncbi:MAG TPA: rhomboid family intramembrane serine protease [Terriglobia bacterium]|nr:rhomboid family intramembrane serine protease [Terriglobia bacterium]
MNDGPIYPSPEPRVPSPERPALETTSPEPTVPSLEPVFPSPEPRTPGPERSSRAPLPIATLTIVAVTVAVMILQMLATGSKNPDVLMDFGASYRPYFQHGQYWRAVMPMFLHIGWWHLVLNMIPLLLLGPVLEQIYGYGRYAAIYVGAGITGSLLSMYHGHNVPAAGASGAVFGVVMATLTAGYVHRDALPHPLARMFRRSRFAAILVVFIVVELVSGYLSQNIDNWGHLGGLLGGGLLAFLIPPPKLVETESGVQKVSLARNPAALLMAPSAPRSVNDWQSQAIVLVPLAVVALSMAAAARHYRVAHLMSQALEEGARLEAAHQEGAAFDQFKRATQLDPRDERPHVALGQLYVLHHQTSDAIDEFTQALRLNPDSTDAQIGLAGAYQDGGDLAAAQKIWEALEKKNPRSIEAQEAIAELLAAQKLYQQAIAEYLKVLRLSPNLAVAHNNLAWLYATADDPKFRDPAGALEHARKAVLLSGGRQPDFLDTLAEALYANGKYAEAVKVETQTLELVPGNKDFQEHLQRYRQAAGNGQ